MTRVLAILACCAAAGLGFSFPPGALAAAPCGFSRLEQAAAGFAAALTVADWAQTRAFTGERPRTIRKTTTYETADTRVTRTTTRQEDARRESNPLLGERPTPQAVNLYFGGMLLAGMALACALGPDTRGPFFWVWGGVEAGFVISNHWAGVRIGGSF